MTWDEKPVALTVTEFLLLEALAARPGVIKSRNQLMDAAYPDDIFVDDRTVDSPYQADAAQNSARWMVSSTPSKPCTAQATASPMAERSSPRVLEQGIERLGWARGISLTWRILAVNILPLALLGGGIFYLDTYRKQLLDERYKLARIEAQITAEALAGATRERQDALLIQIGKEQQMRACACSMREGALWADSFALDEPAFQFDDPDKEDWREDLAPVFGSGGRSDRRRAAHSRLCRTRRTDRCFLARTGPRAGGRHQPDPASRCTGRHAGNQCRRAGGPHGFDPADHPQRHRTLPKTVRSARSTLVSGVFLALFLSVTLSLYMARTIVTPLRALAIAAIRVRQGREREVEVPRLPDRQDEIGLLARAVSDMTEYAARPDRRGRTFRRRCRPHEIKNPLASLRSAVESLGKVDDIDLRKQLTDIASHDVRRIGPAGDGNFRSQPDRRRIARARNSEVFDLAALTEAIVRQREHRDENDRRRVELHKPLSPRHGERRAGADRAGDREPAR